MKRTYFTATSLIRSSIGSCTIEGRIGKASRLLIEERIRSSFCEMKDIIPDQGVGCHTDEYVRNGPQVRGTCKRYEISCSRAGLLKLEWAGGEVGC